MVSSCKACPGHSPPPGMAARQVNFFRKLLMETAFYLFLVIFNTPFLFFKKCLTFFLKRVDYRVMKINERHTLIFTAKPIQFKFHIKKED